MQMNGRRNIFILFFGILTYSQIAFIALRPSNWSMKEALASDSTFRKQSTSNATKIGILKGSTLDLKISRYNDDSGPLIKKSKVSLERNGALNEQLEKGQSNDRRYNSEAIAPEVTKHGQYSLENKSVEEAMIDEHPYRHIKMIQRSSLSNHKDRFEYNQYFPLANGGMLKDAAQQCIKIFSPSLVASSSKATSISPFLQSGVLDTLLKPTINNPINLADFYLEKDYSEISVHLDFSKSLKENREVWWLPSVRYRNSQIVVPENVSTVFATSKHMLHTLLNIKSNLSRDFMIYYTKYPISDIYLPQIERNYQDFLHIIGLGDLNTTELIFNTWLKHPEWPKLTIACRDVEVVLICHSLYSRLSDISFESTDIPSNIEVIRNTLPPTELRILQNRIGLHLYPSQTDEHFINEARAAKAIVLIGDQFPGISDITSMIGNQVQMVSRWKSKLEFESDIVAAIAFDNSSRVAMGDSARKDFITYQKHFNSSMEAVYNAMCKDSNSLAHLEFLYPNSKLSTANQMLSLMQEIKSHIIDPKANSSVVGFQCVNIFIPSLSGGIVEDASLYHKHLPSKIIHGWVKRNSKDHSALPYSKADLYLEQTPGKPFGRGFYRDQQSKSEIWWMPNPEFTDLRHFTDPNVTLIFAKSKHTLSHLLSFREKQNLKYKIYFTKHSSPDKYNPKVTKTYKEFLHLAGTSPFKNTELLVNLWLKHPEWPKVTIVSQYARTVKHFDKVIEQHIKSKNLGSQTTVANINFIRNRLSSADLLNLQNRIGIHICPSLVEGYGHYINEARSTKAVVITGNISPCNELVDSQSGILVGSPKKNEKWGVLASELLQLNETALEKGILRALSLNESEVIRMGDKGRENYLKDSEFFHSAMNALNSTVCGNKMSEEFLKHVYPKDLRRKQNSLKPLK